jgi:hypothetical protein
MYVLNLGFHNFHNDNVDMFVWEETTASRASQEVAFCFIKHLRTSQLKNMLQHTGTRVPDKIALKVGFDTDENRSVPR